MQHLHKCDEFDIYMSGMAPLGPNHRGEVWDSTPHPVKIHAGVSAQNIRIQQKLQQSWAKRYKAGAPLMHLWGQSFFNVKNFLMMHHF